MQGADAVIVALRLSVLKDVIDEIAGALGGNSLVVASNPVGLDAQGKVVRLLPEGQSSGETVAGWLPAGARLAMAFGTCRPISSSPPANAHPSRNAGIFISKPFTDYTFEDYLAITAVNLTGFFHMTQAAIRQMLTQGTGGHIVNITTSLVDHAQSENLAALVSLTKGGLASVTRSVAIEYASGGVRFNAVALGVIKDPLYDPASCEGLARLPPLGRLG